MYNLGAGSSSERLARVQLGPGFAVARGVALSSARRGVGFHWQARLMRKRPSPFAVYIALQGLSSLLFSLIFTVNLLYHVTVANLTPLQLVLVGTTLETTVFLFEIPTGVLADVKSRRLSVIIGYVVMGFGFLVEGLLPFFWPLAAAQVLWGLGYTFTSGATLASSALILLPVLPLYGETIRRGVRSRPADHPASRRQGGHHE